MVKQFNKIGVTSEGYRGNRAILDQRVIEGFEKVSFTGTILRLLQDSPQTIYLDSTNMFEGNKIILPDATTLWPNWKTTIINDSAVSVGVYYYNSDTSTLSLFKEVADGNMATFILLDDSTEQGNWTTFRTTETISADAIDRFTTNVFDTSIIDWGQLQNDDDSEVAVSLGTILAGTSIKSIYIKPTAQFTGMTSLTVSIGIPTNKTLISPTFDLTQALADDYFTKDLLDIMFSTTSDTEIFAYFNGTGLNSLTGGSVNVVVEKTKIIDPTVLKNPIVQTQLPIGTIMNYAFLDTPNGFKRLDGTPIPNANSVIPNFVALLRETNNRLVGEKLIVSYQEWSRINEEHGSCGKFAWQGADLIFPKIGHFIQGLTDLTQFGLLTEAGLPDIVAQMSNENGVLTDSMGSGSGSWENVWWHASAWNPIYGKSDTVQPLSIKYPYIISIYSKVQNESELNVDELIENKANVGLNNLSQSGEDYLKSVVLSNCTAYINENSGIDLTNGSVLPVDALVVITGNPGWYHDTTLYINGIKVYSGGVSENSQRPRAGNCIAKAGSVVTVSGDVSSLKYYPLGE